MADRTEPESLEGPAGTVTDPLRAAGVEVWLDQSELRATTPMATSVRSSAPPALSMGAASTRSMLPASRSLVAWIVIGLLILVMGYFVADKFVRPVRSVPAAETPATAPASAFNPPAHSIAVLPFANMSGDKEQDYLTAARECRGLERHSQRIARIAIRVNGETLVIRQEILHICFFGTV